MSNIRRKLRDIRANVDESMGVRSFEIKVDGVPGLVRCLPTKMWDDCPFEFRSARH